MKHVRQSCLTCGRCCCTGCTKNRRQGKWFAPPSGGYHGCSPVPVTPGHPPRIPAQA